MAQVLCSWTAGVPEIDHASTGGGGGKMDNETIQETDIMLISKHARLPIRRQKFHPLCGGVLNTIARRGFTAILVSIP